MSTIIELFKFLLGEKIWLFPVIIILIIFGMLIILASVLAHLYILFFNENYRYIFLLS